MNRIGERLLRIVLVLLIGISFYLTYLIWVSPVGQDTLLEHRVVNDLTENTPLKKEEDVFLPLKLRYQIGDKNRETQSESLLKNIQHLMNEARYGEAKQIVGKDRADYDRRIALENGFELSYAMTFPQKEYLEIFNLHFVFEEESSLNFTFSKIQIDFEKEVIRFLNDDHYRLIEAKIETNQEELLTVFKESNVQWLTVEENPSFLDNHYLSSDSLKLKQYSYISSSRPYTLFRDAFFTNPKSVRSNSSEFDTYLYESGESLTIKQNQEVIHFQGNPTLPPPLDIYSTSFRYIRRVGSSYGSTRMIDQTGHAIDYRIFVEGFPIFGSNYEGKILLNFKEVNNAGEVNVSIQGNLTSLQIPIPSEEEVVLPSSQEVVETLYYNGLDTSQVKMLLIGYEWKNLEDTGVVDLVPHWYIKYENKWFSYEALLASLTEDE